MQGLFGFRDGRGDAVPASVGAHIGDLYTSDAWGE